MKSNVVRIVAVVLLSIILFSCTIVPMNSECWKHPSGLIVYVTLERFRRTHILGVALANAGFVKLAESEFSWPKDVKYNEIKVVKNNDTYDVEIEVSDFEAVVEVSRRVKDSEPIVERFFAWYSDESSRERGEVAENNEHNENEGYENRGTPPLTQEDKEGLTVAGGMASGIAAGAATGFALGGPVGAVAGAILGNLAGGAAGAGVASTMSDKE